MTSLNEYSSEDEILSVAKSLVGKKVIDIVSDQSIINSSKGKGSIGNLVERYGFGVANNSRPDPDFISAGIELKVVPLEIAGIGLRVKERTKICSIDYSTLVHETWETSHAWKKLRRVLLIFFTYNESDIGQSQIDSFYLYEPDMTDQEILSDDWNKVLNYVKLGEAHLLSESISQVLAASRTGQGGFASDGTPRDQVNQPVVRYNAHAMKRAFSLKPSFTNQLYRERTSSASAFISLKEYVKGKSFKELLENILRGLNKYNDYSLHDFARVHDIELSKSKHRTARLIRAALGITKQSVTFREFERYGISVKTVPVRFEDNKPWENVSFPHQPMQEVLDEGSFGDSMIAEWTRRVLFIPLYRETRDDVELSSIFIGKAFFWRPTSEQDYLMENDYNNYRDTIRNGIVIEHVPWGDGYVRKNNLPKESSTSILHMRPHARDGNDFDYSLNDTRIVKQSFWLNGQFLKDLITAS